MQAEPTQLRRQYRGQGTRWQDRNSLAIFNQRDCRGHERDLTRRRGIELKAGEGLVGESELEYIEVALSGIVFVLAFAHLFGGAQITGSRAVDSLAWVSVALIAIYPHAAGLGLGIAAIFALMWWSRRRYPAVSMS